ncbi:MAG: hypothetical protein HC919_12530, partial [Oscillatoriales cyanobacterium SM2_2_1]|nr:hypothetical protein [Oscillatoriales cyanobacterium SM2_2_1]
LEEPPDRVTFILATTESPAGAADHHFPLPTGFDFRRTSPGRSPST